MMSPLFICDGGGGAGGGGERERIDFVECVHYDWKPILRQKQIKTSLSVVTHAVVMKNCYEINISFKRICPSFRAHRHNNVTTKES